MPRLFARCAACVVLLAAMAISAAPASATEMGAYAWGIRLSGDIGDGNLFGPPCLNSYQCAPEPVPVSGLGNESGNSVVAVAGGEFDSMALLSNGTVVTWGADVSGQLGNGTPLENSLVPVPVSGLTGVIAIAAGRAHDLALLENGKVMAWGANGHGQLGDGTTTSRAAPVEVQGLEGVTGIAAGGEHSLALLSDGTVRAWGANKSGQLGDAKASGLYSATPVQVLGKKGKPLTEVIEVAAGGFGNDGDEEDSLALISDHGVDSWGNNEYGQLGVGTKAKHSTAVEITGLPFYVKQISAGARHNVAVTTIGKVLTWGWNGRSELGYGTPEEHPQSTVPIEVAGLSEITSVSAGESFSLALRSNGTVAAWGWNAYDELGAFDELGEPEERAVPVTVTGLEGVVGVAGAGEHALAFGP